MKADFILLQTFIPCLSHRDGWVQTFQLSPIKNSLPTRRRRLRVRVDGAAIILEPNTAQAIATVLHELATNAAKYGALSDDKGHVDLSWQRGQDGLIRLRWIESGGPIVRTPSRQGFGTRVIEKMVTQLKGRTTFDWCPEGFVCEIVFVA